jgi:glycosyltransferase involved in cell wall biosynthesis
MSKTYKFGICGAFDFEEKGTGGQSVKTREFYFALRNAVGKNKISILESTEYRTNPISFFFKMVSLIKNCENVIIFPANKGIKIFAPMCTFFAPKYRTKIHYNVIGGWLPRLVKENRGLKRCLLKFDTILVETSTMKRDLEGQGFSNIYRLANFKELAPVTEIKTVSKPVHICYFSRVAKLKGIEDAVKVVNRINNNKISCIFDIYGPVVPDYEKDFQQIQKSFGKEITYKGKIDPRNSVKTITQYDIQLFPTLYATEGIPGSIVDSYFAGTPVVAAKWNSFSDVVKDGVTGIGYEQHNVEDFYRKLSAIITQPEEIMKMKKNCLREAENYKPKVVIEQFLQIIEDLS